MTSFIYRVPAIYTLVMRTLYLGHYPERFRAIGEAISDGSSVVELCCGDCMLYRRELAGRTDYLGLDINPAFIAAGQRRGISVQACNLLGDEPLPTADVLLIHASLYQFMPHHQALVDRMFAAARRRVIIAEPVRNLATSRNPILAWIGRCGTNPGTGETPMRFTDESFGDFARSQRTPPCELTHIAGDRECLAVFDITRKSEA